MSAEASKIDTCASCGIAESDDVKLKRCNGCYLVRYCGIECQKKHRREHKEECKKRAAELRDEVLFKQPESSYLGDCLICCLPLPLDEMKSVMGTCCGKIVCVGCHYADLKRIVAGQRLQHKCLFCRQSPPNSDEEQLQFLQKRIEANDPFAIKEMGVICTDREDYKSAFEYFSKAARLGDLSAHYRLACLYHEGNFVEKDEKKEWHHLEEAAIGGHSVARHNLAYLEDRRGRYDRVVKHLVIAANMGDDKSLESLKKYYQDGLVSKEDLASALRAHQAAIDATKSPQREEGEAFLRLRQGLRKHGG